jgi:hypothetical protein
MGYQSINNLYKSQDILAFKTVYALEKVHGTSANISWTDGKVGFFSGGTKYETFISLFDAEALTAKLQEHFGAINVIIYGESYGGKEQGMSATYGTTPRFVAFDVKVRDCWLDVPNAHGVCIKMGIEFVDYDLIDSSLASIDACRDKPSTQGLRHGMGEHPREGIVLRPPFEVTDGHGDRVIAKHKRDEFRETSSPRVVKDPEQLAVLTQADKVANEWVTPIRLEHVMAQLIVLHSTPEKQVEMKDIPALIRLMVADVEREGAGELVMSKEVAKAIGTRTVWQLKAYLAARLREGR